MRAPEFWRHDGPTARALAPFGWIYQAAAAARARSTTGWRAPVPVICIGNLVAGGAGKTPVALSVAARLVTLGVAPHFLTRGYGGRLAGPVLADGSIHSARDVGDEPLLLSRVAPTWVSRDRGAGARAAVDSGAEAIVMDDGYQNPGLLKDISIVVIDGLYGFGNGRMIPAGPLRESVRHGLARADAAVVIGPDRVGVEAGLTGTVPVLRARMVPAVGADRLAGRRVVAFAGIGRPEKFFATLVEMGCEVVSARGFPDHHVYSETEVMGLVEQAATGDAIPVTTAKDSVRLPEAARPMVSVLDIDLEWDDADALARLLRPITDLARRAAHG